MELELSIMMTMIMIMMTRCWLVTTCSWSL